MYIYDNGWKSLANAIIHDGFDPLVSVTIIACERCHNPYMHMIVSNDFPLHDDLSRIGITLYHCPKCGHIELDCFGTYAMPDYLPGSVLPFIGHFFELWYLLLMKARELEPDKVSKDAIRSAKNLKKQVKG